MGAELFILRTKLLSAMLIFLSHSTRLELIVNRICALANDCSTSRSSRLWWSKWSRDGYTTLSIRWSVRLTIINWINRNGLVTKPLLLSILINSRYWSSISRMKIGMTSIVFMHTCWDYVVLTLMIINSPSQDVFIRQLIHLLQTLLERLDSGRLNNLGTLQSGFLAWQWFGILSSWAISLVIEISRVVGSLGYALLVLIEWGALRCLSSYLFI